MNCSILSCALLILLNFNFNISSANQKIEEVENDNETEATSNETIVSTTNVPSTTGQPQKKPIQTTTLRPRRAPCKCNEGTCKCCTGALMQRFNVTQRNKACVNINYNPDDFEFQYKLLFNNWVLYQSKLSGKNPPPVCLPIRRFFPGNLCLRFSNVYMVGRNIHACAELETVWNDQELFQVSFDCIRAGANGIALVKPEEGGGLPTQVDEDELEPSDEDYDDSARSHHIKNTEKI